MDLSKRPTMESLFRARYSDDDYDPDELIKATKWERNFGSFFDTGNTMADPIHPLLRHHKRRLLESKLNDKKTD